MTEIQHETIVSDKDKVVGSSQEHLETLSTAPKEKDSGALLTSAFAAYSKTQIMRKFWRLYAFGLAVSLGGMYAGYCSNAVGNIVANPGFIAQFGTVTNADGVLELAATHVSLWSGFQYVGQVVFQAISPFISDRFGRRIAMYTLNGLMLIVSRVSVPLKGYDSMANETGRHPRNCRSRLASVPGGQNSGGCFECLPGHCCCECEGPSRSAVSRLTCIHR